MISVDLNELIELLKSLLSKTEIKSEQKIFKRFVGTLSSLKEKKLNPEQFDSIEEKLSSLNLASNPDYKKKFYKQKHAELLSFLKSEFSFTTPRYYTEIGMIYGMTLGTGLGISIGVSFDPIIGSSIGLSLGAGLGLAFGMMYGAKKDEVAQSLGRVI